MRAEGRRGEERGGEGRRGEERGGEGRRGEERGGDKEETRRRQGGAAVELQNKRKKKHFPPSLPTCHAPSCRLRCESTAPNVIIWSSSPGIKCGRFEARTAGTTLASGCARAR